MKDNIIGLVLLLIAFAAATVGTLFAWPLILYSWQYWAERLQ